MNILIIGGFLGSGKTTFINHLLKQHKDDIGSKVAIIENERGKMGVDNFILQNEHVKISAITGGCVCCQLAGELIDAVNSIYEAINPDNLWIELSGVGKPYTVMDALNKYVKVKDMNIKIATLVDASRFSILGSVMPDFIREQTMKSDLLVVTKIEEEEYRKGVFEKEIRGLTGFQEAILPCYENGKGGYEIGEKLEMFK